MRLGTLNLGIAVSALLLVGAGVLYTMAEDRGVRHYRECIDLIHQIQRLSSSRSIEIARVRADPLADFDALATFRFQMERLKSALDETAQLIPDLPERLAEDINLFVDAVDANEKRIERFKTTYAVVRNSTRYLPLAAASLTRQAQGVGAESLVRIIAIVVQDMNQYLATPTEPSKARVGGVLDELRTASVGFPPALANGLTTLTAHMEVLLSRQVPMNVLFRAATSEEITESGSRLSRDMELELGKDLTVATYYERGVVALLVALVMFWLVLVVRSRAFAQAASPKVGARTMELRETTVGVTGEEHEPGATPVGLSAESAILYDFLVPRAGDNLVSLTDRVLTRIDSLHQTQRRMHQVLPADPSSASPAEINFDEEFDASSTTGAHLHREVNLIADFAKRLASFSALPNRAAERASVDVNACIDEVVTAIGAKRSAAVSTRYGEVPEINASRSEIRLLLAQVLLNSMQAVGKLEKRKRLINVYTSFADNRLSVTIVDNGAGIPQETKRNIFKAFYTSRDNAMGIGLTLSADLVRRHKGTITVQSVLGQGTIVRIAFPIGSQSASPLLSE